MWANKTLNHRNVSMERGHENEEQFFMNVKRPAKSQGVFVYGVCRLKLKGITTKIFLLLLLI